MWKKIIYPTTYTYDLVVKRTTRNYTEVIISTDFQSWMEMYSRYLYTGTRTLKYDIRSSRAVQSCLYVYVQYVDTTYVDIWRAVC